MIDNIVYFQNYKDNREKGGSDDNRYTIQVNIPQKDLSDKDFERLTTHLDTLMHKII